MSTTASTTGEIVGSKRLAKELRVSARWLETEVREGRLPGIAAGGSCIFNREAITEALAKRAEGKQS